MRGGGCIINQAMISNRAFAEKNAAILNLQTPAIISEAMPTFVDSLLLS